MSTLGIDIGTTGCKAIVFGDDGRRLSAAYREYPLSSPRTGWAELDSALVLRSCHEVIAEAAAAAARDPVRAMGISSQGEAFTPVDARGAFLCDAMVSSDTRAADIAARASESFGRERLYRITGHTAHPLFTLFKLLWLRDHRPDLWDGAVKFHCFEELLQRSLGLEPAISWPLAGRTMLFNVATHGWDPEILGFVGLDPARLAPPVSPGSVVGHVPTAVARSLGLGDKVLVVAGGHDQPVSALGAGATAPGQAFYSMGTVECICPAFPAPVFSRELFESNLCTYDHAAAGMYATVAYSLTGGNLLRWFRDQWSPLEREQAARGGADPYDLILEGMSPEPTALQVLPYFTPSGTPYFSLDVPGAILGLRLSTTRGEVLRALIEGVCLEMRLNLDILARSNLRVTELRAGGGGARNRRLCQLKADVLDCPLVTVREPEAGCLGTAMLAQAALEGALPAELAPYWVKTGETIEPDPANARRYAEKSEHYARLYPLLRELRFPEGKENP